jgi:hypothetical protein
LLHRISGFLLTAAIALPIPAVAQSVAPPTAIEPPAATKVLPANTPGLLLVNLTGETWQALNRFSPNPELTTLNVPMLDSFLVPALGFSFEQDIQSWLGKQAAIALLPATEGVTTFGEKAVMLVPSTNSDRLQAFIEKLKPKLGQPPTERDYKGIKILEWTTIAPANPESPTPSERPADADSPRPLPVLPAPKASAATKQIQSCASPLLKCEQAPEAEIQSAPKSEGFQPRNVAIAVVANHLAVAMEAKTLETLIDLQTGEKSLAQNPQFQRTMQHPQFGRSLTVVYGEFAGILKFLTPLLDKPDPLTQTLLQLLPAGFDQTTSGFDTAQAEPQRSPAPPAQPRPPAPPARPRMPPQPRPENKPEPFDPARLEAIYKDYSTFDAFTWVEPLGIRSQSNIFYTTPKPELATQSVPNPDQIVRRLPATTYLGVNSRNFKQQWEIALKSLADDPVTQRGIQKAREELRKNAGLDLDKDIIGWMDGEYAVVAFPSKQGLFNTVSPNFDMEFGVMLQTSDRPRAEALLRKLEQLAKSSSPNPSNQPIIVNRSVNGTPVVSWEGKDFRRAGNFSVFAYGWIDQDTLLITTGTGAMTALAPKPGLPLDRSFLFKTATESLPTPNDGYFYVNMGASLSWAYALARPFLPTESSYAIGFQLFQTAIGRIRSLSYTSLSTPEKQQVDSLLVLAVTQPPKPANPQPEGREVFEKIP